MFAYGIGVPSIDMIDTKEARYKDAKDL